MEETPSKPSDGEHGRWVTEIQLYDREAEKWVTRSRRIVKRYKDERSTKETDDSNRRYNILYSNVQTLLPAYFSRNPKPDIERRFKDQDDVGRIAAEVWERSTTYFTDTDKFRHCIKQAVMDRLLPGRGVVWVRYIPHMKDVQVIGNTEVKDEGEQITEDVSAEGYGENPLQEVVFEEVSPDYVHWEDFGHTVSRTWEEVRAVWRKVYLTREELIERFGKEIGEAVPLDYSPKGLNDEKSPDEMKKATVYEIWDKPSKTALWLHKDYPALLDKLDDPLGLERFFPCPGPLYPTMTNDSLIPVPDFVQYQDQAKELDDLTARIAAILRAVKVAGVYDASAAGVERLLTEGTENKLIPVEQWAIFGEKGGLKGVMDLLPTKDILETLLGLYEAREKVKADLYEITGIADIIRGASKASETATAQNIKGQYAALRLDDGQQAVQRFARSLVRIVAEIIANHFSIDTIKAISGMQLFTEAEKQQVRIQYAPKPPLPGQPPAPPPPIPEELEEKMANPSWEEVGALLKDNAMRCFRIDIETDSTLKADQDANKQAATEFLQSAATFIAQTAPVAQQVPALQPLFMEMLMFGVRSYPIGKNLETTFELTKQKLQKMQEQAEQQPPKPDPEMAKVQGQLKLQSDAQTHKQQMDNMTAQNNAKQKMLEAQQEHEKQLAETQSDTAIQIAKEQHDADVEKTRMAYEDAQKRAQMERQFQLDEKIELLKLAIQYEANKAKSDDDDVESPPDNTADISKIMAPLLDSLKQTLGAPKTITMDNGRTAVVSQ